MEEIKLTLTPAISEAPTAEEVKNISVEQVTFDESSLSEGERLMVEEFSKKIDIRDSTMVLQYGSGAQEKVADFSDAALGSVKTVELGEVGEMMTNLVCELKNFNDEEKKGFLGLFKKAKNKIETLKIKYDKAASSVDSISGQLENHQDVLLKDIAILDKLYETNLSHFKELSMYIIAGKKRLNEARNTELVALKEKAEATKLPEDAQAASDFASLCDRFEKRIYDLELTRMVAIQMAPQIRLVQNNDTIMAEKIQSTIMNTIPLWKSQMVIALGIAHSQEAINAERAVNDLTNDLLKRNADALKVATIETAREAERGIVDIDTIQYTNDALISTLDEVMQIQAEGKEQRRNAEIELVKMENSLKDRLIRAE